jgi:hypothetical protein
MSDQRTQQEMTAADNRSVTENDAVQMKPSLMDATKKAKMPHIEQVVSQKPDVSQKPGVSQELSTSRNPMFDRLVEREEDTVGLLAYALYKQTKRDWLIAFDETHARAPTDAESRAFITGEQLPRRLQTYRQLAQQQLGLLPVTTMAAPAAETHTATHAAVSPPKTGFFPLNKATLRYLAIMTGLVVGMAIVFRIVAGWLFR